MEINRNKQLRTEFLWSTFWTLLKIRKIRKRLYVISQLKVLLNSKKTLSNNEVFLLLFFSIFVRIDISPFVGENKPDIFARTTIKTKCRSRLID